MTGWVEHGYRTIVPAWITGQTIVFYFCGTPFVLRYSHPCKPRSHIAFAKSQGAIKKFSLGKGQSGFQISFLIPEAFDIFKHTETPKHSGWEYLQFPYLLSRLQASSCLLACLLERHLPHVVWQRCGASKSGCRVSRSAALAESGLRGWEFSWTGLGLEVICFGVWVRLPKLLKKNCDQIRGWWSKPYLDNM